MYRGDFRLVHSVPSRDTTGRCDWSQEYPGVLPSNAAHFPLRGRSGVTGHPATRFRRYPCARVSEAQFGFVPFRLY